MYLASHISTFPLIFFSFFYFLLYTTYSFFISWCFGCSWKKEQNKTTILVYDHKNEQPLQQLQPEKKVHVSTADGSMYRYMDGNTSIRYRTSTDTHADTSCICVCRTFLLNLCLCWEMFGGKPGKVPEHQSKTSSALVLAAAVSVYQSSADVSAASFCLCCCFL